MADAQPEQGPPAEGGGPGARGEVTDHDLVLEVTHAQMDAAVQAGDAIPLGSAGGWLARYRDAWWVLCGLEWLRITDEATIADIDHVAARLAQVAQVAGDNASAGGR